jgi:proteic killer suppression protein
MIISFGDDATDDLYNGKSTARVRAFPQDILSRARDKLDILDAVTSLEDLRAPPSNHLEKLGGNRAGYHSIRVNKRWRIVFRWDGGAHEVRLLDYH